MQTKTEVLQQCTITGNIVKLPNTQLDRNLYLEVSKALNLIGGKWKGGNTQGFIFPSDPTELLEQIANGENRNLKKEYQFFATPPQLAAELVRLACFSGKVKESVLEPSAGQGAIVKAILDYDRRTNIHWVEIMPTNIMMMDKQFKLISNVKNLKCPNEDFLNYDCSMLFDRIIANPPFSKNQDIDHVYKMWQCLKAGGRIVTVSSNHWQLSTNKKENEFKAWLKKVGAEIEDVPRETFKESGTLVGACILVIDKPFD